MSLRGLFPANFFPANCMVILLACSSFAVQAANTGGSKSGSGVASAALSAEGARVVVMLQEPSQGAGRASSPAQRQTLIANSQQSVRTAAGPGFELKVGFQSVPAMAGVIRNGRSLVALENHPDVLKIDLDVGGQASLFSSVPHINADNRHAAGNSGSGVVVAVFDTGMDTDHSNLSDDLVHEACFGDTDGSIDGTGLCPNGSDRQVGAGSAEDINGHGSHVSGIISSNGSSGGVGAAPDADIVAIKVLLGTSGFFSFFSEIVAGMDYIISNPGLNVKVINMSLGTNALFTGDCDNAAAFTMAGAAAVNTLRSQGVIVVAAAGNNGSATQMAAPGCISNVLSVGASDNFDTPASFTNSNASTDVFGPGVSVSSSWLANSTLSISGTSMASPHAAACAALLIESGEAVTPEEIELRLENSAESVTVAGNGLTFPRIDCGYVDPDDSIAEANRTGFGVTVRDSIDSLTDVDLYGFYADNGQVFDIDVDIPNPDLDSVLRVFDDTGAQLAFSDDDVGPAPEPFAVESFISFTAPSAGTYYVGVSNFSNTLYDPTDGTGDTGGGAFGGGDTGQYELIIRPNAPALPPSPSTGDRAGFAVTIAGDYAAVGVRLADEGGFSNSGAVDIYKKASNGTWSFLTRVVSTMAHDNAHFGHAIDLDETGSTLFVGEERQNSAGFRAGWIYSFGRDTGGVDNWGLTGSGTLGSPGTRDRLGRSVSIANGVFYAGIPNADAVGADSGRAHSSFGELVPLDRGAGDKFGNAMSADGDTVIVGAFRNDDMGSNSGSAYVFDRNEGGGNNYGQVVKLLPSDGITNDQFGYSVSVSGDTAVVGSRFSDTPTANQTGAIYVFERNEGGANNWGQTAKLIPMDATAGDRFGSSVAIDGDFIVGGSPKRGEFGSEAGKAYAFRRVAGEWVESAELFNESVTIRDEFGIGVAVDGNSCIVGSWLDNQPGNNNSGSAHLFGL